MERLPCLALLVLRCWAAGDASPWLQPPDAYMINFCRVSDKLRRLQAARKGVALFMLLQHQSTPCLFAPPASMHPIKDLLTSALSPPSATLDPNLRPSPWSGREYSLSRQCFCFMHTTSVCRSCSTAFGSLSSATSFALVASWCAATASSRRHGQAPVCALGVGLQKSCAMSPQVQVP